MSKCELQQKGSSKREREGVQYGSETSHVLWVGDYGIDKKLTGGRAGGSRVKDSQICIESDKDGWDEGQPRLDGLETKQER